MLLVAAANFAACATMSDPPPTLYKRLGGREGIAIVVGDFVTNMAGDSRVNARFKDMKPADVEKLKSNLADQICDATGGPCSYLGRDMKTVHKGMKITDASGARPSRTCPRRSTRTRSTRKTRPSCSACSAR
jgi:hemoglobin